MPIRRVPGTGADELVAAVEQLERNGDKVVQVVDNNGGAWTLLCESRPQRAPRERRS